jgi:hypothetical protein
LFFTQLDSAVTRVKRGKQLVAAERGRVGKARLSRDFGKGKGTEIWLRERIFPYFSLPVDSPKGVNLGKEAVKAGM